MNYFIYNADIDRGLEFMFSVVPTDIVISWTNDMDEYQVFKVIEIDEIESVVRFGSYTSNCPNNRIQVVVDYIFVNLPISLWSMSCDMNLFDQFRMEFG